MDGFYRTEGIVGVEKAAAGGDRLIRAEAGSTRNSPKTSAYSDHLVTWHSGLAVNWSRLGRSGHAERPVNLALKRVMDIFGSIAALVILAPLLILVALVIKVTSPGPVFFRQVREGRNGVPFSVYKFRSMHMASCDIAGIAHTVDNDPRVTKVGRFIRKTSIDELPQLFNVLLGDMSLVGPRPHVPGMLAAGMNYRQLVRDYDERLRMRPGITGWAQANGLRGSASNPHAARERIHHDIAYVQNFSIWLDLKIIARTVLREFLSGTGN